MRPGLVALVMAVALAACSPATPGVPDCATLDEAVALAGRVDRERWLQRVRALSGAEPVTVGGQTTTLRTRDSWAMAAGDPGAEAFEWLHEQVAALVPAEAIAVERFRQNWRNLTVTIPGRSRPGQVVVVTAHLDSLVMDGDRLDSAPGADDDASGVATLLELAEVLVDASPARTLLLAWTTGEEQGLVGCEAWADAHDLSGVVAVLDLDMLGWDGTGARTLQAHLEDTDDGRRLGSCVARAAAAASPDLHVDLRVGAAAMGNSCHSAFWHRGVPAALLSEDVTTPGAENPHAHTPRDTVDTLALPYAVDMARAAVATALALVEAR